MCPVSCPLLPPVSCGVWLLSMRRMLLQTQMVSMLKMIFCIFVSRGSVLCFAGFFLCFSASVLSCLFAHLLLCFSASLLLCMYASFSLFIRLSASLLLCSPASLLLCFATFLFPNACLPPCFSFSPLLCFFLLCCFSSLFSAPFRACHYFNNAVGISGGRANVDNCGRRCIVADYLKSHTATKSLVFQTVFVSLRTFPWFIALRLLPVSFQHETAIIIHRLFSFLLPSSCFVVYFFRVFSLNETK